MAEKTETNLQLERLLAETERIRTVPSSPMEIQIKLLRLRAEILGNIGHNRGLLEISKAISNLAFEISQARAGSHTVKLEAGRYSIPKIKLEGLDSLLVRLAGPLTSCEGSVRVRLEPSDHPEASEEETDHASN